LEELTSTDVAEFESQLAESRGKLDGYVRVLHGIDEELESLTNERRNSQSLQEICSAIDALGDLGADGLFWDGLIDAGAGREHLNVVRGRVEAFEKRIGEVEDRRREILEEIDQVQETVEYIEYDLLEEQRRVEERKQEWIVEREISKLAARASIMPWTRGEEDDQRFRKSLLVALLSSITLGLIFPHIDLPIPDRWEVIEIPDRFTRLIREQELAPPPPPPVQEEAKLAEKNPEKAEASPQPEAAPKQTQPKKAETTTKGILAFREKFSSLADSKPTAKLGAKARLRNSGKTASGRPQRSLVTSQASASSGGIDVGDLSRDAGTGGEAKFERVQITQATSAIGAVAGSDRPLSGGPGLSRTDEEIQIVFDRHKSALYRLYNRELRKNPTLRGQMVLRFTIEPDGKVSLCEVQSSDMKAPQLSAKVVGRVKTFDFGAKDGISAITILYPIDFLPAA
jgi:hypothetical protein